ncbi:hypothetical protein ACIBQ6_13410 [Nonomuraea sp. NPDC049655]|uniref:hypothetical protein n=1 Tax=Nonomuraea sp. NPDC049655 TaxID=3364355 RepID=UPI0037A21751
MPSSKRTAALLEEARRELDRLRASPDEHARHAETLRAAAADLARERALAAGLLALSSRT